ncbi:Gp15 family bacteriophage protein [Weissella tructae]|uniref:Gp15 family bacteriophage protein n=1 Tax=Weissella tructae TaxID=887702 RepID=UPI003D94114C
MFLLNQELDDTVEINGREIELDLSFDNVLDVFDVFKETADESEKIYAAVYLLTGEKVIDELEGEEIALVLSKALDDHIKTDNSQEFVEYDLAGNPMTRADDSDEEEGNKIISLEWDAEYIWTSFVQAYDIDLHQEFGSLHWRKFKALLRDLPQETKIKQIIEIRSWKPTADTTADEKKRMKKLQEEYELPDE